VMMTVSILASNLTARPNTVTIGIGRTTLTKQTVDFQNQKYQKLIEV